MIGHFRSVNAVVAVTGVDLSEFLFVALGSKVVDQIDFVLFFSLGFGFIIPHALGRTSKAKHCEDDLDGAHDDPRFSVHVGVILGSFPVLLLGHLLGLSEVQRGSHGYLVLCMVLVLFQPLVALLSSDDLTQEVVSSEFHNGQNEEKVDTNQGCLEAIPSATGLQRTHII